MKSEFQNWSDVRVFLAVLRSGSTLAASRSLGMAQPTVARRIDALEHTLRVTLFERDTRGFRPTPAAEALRAAAERMRAAADDLAGAAQTARRSDAPHIRFTAPNVNFTANLAKILSDFTEGYGPVEFDLIASYEMIDLMAGEADVALRIAHELDEDRLICRRMTTAKVGVYAAASYAERKGTPSGPEELAGHRIVMPEDRDGLLRVHTWLAGLVRDDQIVSRCATVESLYATVRAGLGVGPVPRGLASEDPTLVHCFWAPETTSSSSWLVASPEAYKRPEVKAFMSFFPPRFQALMTL